MTTAPNLNTSAWRLPSKNKAGEKRAGRFDRNAYAKLGLAGVVESTEGVKDRPPSDGYAEPREEGRASIPSSGGLPTVNTSSWSLSEARKPPKGPPSERGKKWDADTPPRHGKPVLFGGEEDKQENLGRSEMKGLSMDRIAQLRRLAGLEQNEEIEFSLGTPHRQMPEEGRAVPRQEVREAREPGSTSRLPPEVRRLVEPRAPLPSGGFVPPTTHGSGILDPVTEGEDHGTDYVNRILAESQWFLKDFGRLAGVSEGGEPGRGPWKGSNPDYADAMDDPEDPKDPEDPEDTVDQGTGGMGESRILIRHTGPGGRGKAVRQHKQSRASKFRNKDPRTRRAKQNWERHHKASRARSARMRHAEMEDIDLDEFSPEAVEERIGDIIKRAGGRLSRGTKQSRGLVDKAKAKIDKAKGQVKKSYGRWHSKEAKKAARRKKAKARLKRIKRQSR